MVSINYATREVTCKIVYYGPGLSGKTTNLQVVHEKVPQNTRGKLISLATEADRTLYFDFLPINIGSINGFAAKFQLYTVPGQVYYNATRKLVLRGVDGVVFVADAQADKLDDNLESLSNLKENLLEYGYDLADLPIVIQYNKTDLPTAMKPEELDEKLNTLNWPSFSAVAVKGTGVFDTLKAIMKIVLEKARSGGSKQKAPTATPQARAEAEAPARKTYEEHLAEEERKSASASPAMAEADSSSEKVTEETADIASASGSVAVAGPATAKIATPKAAKPAPASGGSIFGARPASASANRKQVGFGASGSGGSGGSAAPPVVPATPTRPAPEEESIPTGKQPTIFGSGKPQSAPEGPVDSSDDLTVRQPAPVRDTQSKEKQTDSDSAGEKRQWPTSSGAVGYDPLEEAPVQSRPKKRGFFSRLFGRK